MQHSLLKTRTGT